MTAALLDHLWQSTLFALAAALVTLALRRNEARVRFWVWFAAAAKFLIPFALLSALGSQFGEHRAAQAAVPVQAFVNVVQQIVEPLTSPTTLGRRSGMAGSSLETVVLMVWGLGCVLLLMRWGVRWMKIRATLANAVPATIAAPVTVNKRIPVKLTAQLWEPAVVGLLRPVLLLPSGIAERLTTAQLQSVIAHEVCHVRRRDNLTAALQMLIEAIFWFHPLVWWIGARMVEERERACDEGVLAMWNQPEVYAEGILKVCRFYVESKLACVAGVSGADLKKRVEIIMTQRTMLRLNAARKVLLATATALAVAIPVVTGLLGAPRVAAQETAPQSAPQTAATHGTTPAVFDQVAIVKSAGQGIQWIMLKDDGLTEQGTSMRMVIASAYGVNSSRIVGGPSWMDTPLYDIVAKVSHSGPGHDPSPANYQRMIQALLASRFGLVAHPNTQQLAVYTLHVDESGARLKPAVGDPPGSAPRRRGFNIQPGVLVATGVDMNLFTGILDRQLGRPILDRTGLKGRYDFTLTGPLGKELLPAALHKQLGLNVEPATVPMDVIVVDQLEEPALDSPEAFAKLGGGVPPFPRKS
jgi:bla regulator protein blaR1